MSTADSQTNLSFSNSGGTGIPPSGGSSDSTTSGGSGLKFWLDGEVLACRCPECGSPMSIRLWLMIADCWRCGTSIELTEEEEQQALRLLGQAEEPAPKQAIPKAPPAPAAKREPSAVPPPVAKPKPVTRPIPRQQEVPHSTSGSRQNAARKPGRVRQHLSEVNAAGEASLWLRELLRNMPSWLASAIIHMALLLILAFVLHMPKVEPPRMLVLSTQVGPEDEEGVYEEMPELEPLEFDDPGLDQPEPEMLTPKDPGDETPFAEVEVQPSEDFIGELPELATLPGGGLPQGAGGKSMFAGRNAMSRARLVDREGGTIESEAAVARGLEWLARHQHADGSWRLNHFGPACKGRCTAAGCNSDTAGTALALLPFLGAGHTHYSGKYQEEIRKALYWLVRTQGRDGDLRSGNGRMYSHGQATIALCEALAMTQDPELRAPAQLAVDYIVKAQHKAGGWRYTPGQPGDTSVVGWQLMALRSAQMAYLHVPPSVFEDAGRFLDTVEDARGNNTPGSRYGYMPGSGSSPTMTAEALLCRQYSGWDAKHPGLNDGCRYLVTHHAPKTRGLNLYYCYYATQVMHHMGGTYWDRWNPLMRDVLVSTQETKGHQAGSWTPQGGHDSNGGRIYMTALAVCTLEVYYRHMPIYQRAAVDR